jgi:hypothetical protein
VEAEGSMMMILQWITENRFEFVEFCWIFGCWKLGFMHDEDECSSFSW